MKIKVIIAAAVLLLGVVIGYLSLTIAGDSTADTFVVADWEALDAAKLESRLEAIARAEALPRDNEKAFLAWLFRNHADAGEAFVRAHAMQLENLPWFMSDTAWDLVRAREVETGMRILSLAQQLFPNDPDVLGYMGVVAYLSGNQAEARRFLEEAETWRRNRPIVDFYLGGLLVMSDSAADRTRGKTILLGLVRGGNAELRELSGLTLLTNTNIPMIQQDLETVYATLEQDGVFRMGNTNLPIEAMRVLTTRLVGGMPDAALQVAELMMQYPNATAEDYLNMIRFSQILGRPQLARRYLDRLQDNATLAGELADDVRLERLTVAQAFLDGRHEEGLAGLKALVEAPEPDVRALQDTFQAIIKNELPMSVEQQFLELYLNLPVQNLRTSITVLTRLLQIDPLDRRTYVSYAINTLLPLEPGLVGSWLTEVDAAAEIIAAIESAAPELTTDQHIVLVNAYLKETKPAEAQAALDRAGPAIDPATQAFLQARILQMQGDKAKAIPYWEEAYQLVSGSTRFPLMKTLGFLALDLDQPVNAMQLLYTSLTAGIPFSQAEAGKLIELTLSYGNLRQSIAVAEYLMNRFPDSPVHKNNLAYFKFLAKENIEEHVEIMRKLVDEFGDIHQYRMTLALGLVRAGRTNEANRLLKSMTIDWGATSTRGLLIYAVVLMASNERVVASGLVQNLDTSDLIPEEKALLTEY